jgi:sirohydrochlorin ferrochelatase
VSTGLIIFGHGSSVAAANAAIDKVSDQIRREGSFPLVQAAFLEFGKPNLEEAVARLVAQGATRILVLPYFLTLGVHLQRDLPRIVSRISSSYNKLEILVGAPLDEHPALVEILLDRARMALAGENSARAH